MPIIRYVFLLALVILAGGGTVWVAYAATASGQLNGQAFMALMPLVMLATIAVRALGQRPKE
jgi:hypothetical protein